MVIFICVLVANKLASFSIGAGHIVGKIPALGMLEPALSPLRTFSLHEETTGSSFIITGTFSGGCILSPVVVILVDMKKSTFVTSLTSPLLVVVADFG